MAEIGKRRRKRNGRKMDGRKMDGRKMGWGKDGGGRSDALDKAIAVGSAPVPGRINPTTHVGSV